MKSNVCPYLGLQEDPATALDFPSPGNFCHHAQPAVPIKGSYQEQFCLSGEHTACPIFLAAHPIPAPVEIVAPPSAVPPSRRIPAKIVVPALLACIAALALVWNVFGFRPGAVVPNTGDTSRPTGAFAAITGPGSAPADNMFQVASPAPSPEPTNINCPRSEGWVPYTVNPTDSLYRLSVIYGVSVEQLQKINCLGEKAVILPGQVIFVPLQATNTPTPIPTRIPVYVYSTNTSEPQQEDPAPAPAADVPAAPAPATNPPTAVPAAAVPPTNPPPPPSEKPKPPSVSDQPKPSSGDTKVTNNNNNSNNNNKDQNGKGKGKDKKKGK